MTINDKKEIIQPDPYSDDAQMNARLVSDWYDRVATNVDKCPFCDLREKYIITQTKDLVLTVNLFPYVDGHLMVVPKRHVEKLIDLKSTEWRSVKKLVDIGMLLIKRELNCADLNVIYREGTKAAGTSVGHLHIHIIPITTSFLVYEKVKFTWNFQKITVTPRDMAERLRLAYSKIE